MLFNTLKFALFFPAVFFVYYALPPRFRWLFLLAASTFFYMAFVPAYILLLGALIFVDYLAALGMERWPDERRRRLILTVSLLFNVGFLGLFKYFNFFNENIEALAHLIGWNYGVHNLSLLLPVGLSFHTFQSMSYTIEVYCQRYPAERNFGRYALYVLFFPQLVAGPIERPQSLLPQLHQTPRFDYRRVTDGLKLMATGLLKKMVVADGVTGLVDRVYGDYRHMPGPLLVLATYFFAIQIYADFSGYTDIARGAARVLGFELSLNFDKPYLARSMSEFWARWHISLTSWFRIYLYPPIALFFARRARALTRLALLLVFLISGLWHGANWTFVFWGTLNGLFIIAEPIWRAPFRGRQLGWLEQVVTFHLVWITWIFFRAESLSAGFYILGHLFSGWGAPILWPAAKCFLLIAGFWGCQWLDARIPIWRRVEKMSRPWRWAFYYTVLLVFFFFTPPAGKQFIYFQF